MNKPVIKLCDKCSGNIVFDMRMLGYMTINSICDECKGNIMKVIKPKAD